MTDHELASITVLNLFCLNGILQDKLEQVAGRRQKQIERVMQIHCKRRKNKPCLIGVILESSRKNIHLCRISQRQMRRIVFLFQCLLCTESKYL